MFFQKCLYLIARFITGAFQLSYSRFESDETRCASFLTDIGPKMLITKNDIVVKLGNLFWTEAIIDKKTGKLTSCKICAFSLKPGEKVIFGMTRVYQEYAALTRPLEI